MARRKGNAKISAGKKSCAKTGVKGVTAKNQPEMKLHFVEKKVEFSCNCGGSSSISAESQPSSTKMETDPSAEEALSCCLRQRCGSALNSGDLSDVTFIVGQEGLKQKFRAHKLILSFGSAVFKTMFSKEWSKPDDIEIPDVEPAAFFNLLSFLYTDEVSLTSEDVLATWNAARKYSIQPLEERCVKFLMSSVDPENAFDVLKIANFFTEQRLVNQCLKEIDQNTSAAISARCFLDIDSQLLHSTLQRDYLNVPEIELFKALLRWSKAECERKNLPMTEESKVSVCEEYLSHIRFPLMTIEDISSTVVPTGLLKNDALVSLYQCLSLNLKPPNGFNSSPRSRIIFKVPCLQESNVKLHQYDSAVTIRERIIFMADYDVKLLGVRLNETDRGTRQYSLTAVTEIESPLPEFKEKEPTVTKKEGSIREVLFLHPVKVKARSGVVVTLRVKGIKSFYTKATQDSFAVTLPLGSTITVLSGRNTEPSTGKVIGLIHELVLST